ncbi:MAG TPA: D-2-hydroxyacid dehydrogenase [Candidatus Pullilachnospira intestinigallinarum]|nr:D-2-hydroxyacid dehydrogenase [Candidatus Pullilachnospira intestinigallinarum]
MEKILIVLPVEERHREMFQKAAPEAELIYCLADQVTREQVQEANVIIGNVPREYLKDSPNLRWIQLNNAGTEGFCDPGALPEGTLLTNATGAYGMAISEHLIAMLFMIQKHLGTYRDQQKEHLWLKQGPMLVTEGSTVLILGLGDIGSTFARKMKAMGSYVIGVRRTLRRMPEYVDEQYTMDALHELLPRADVVALSLPGYAATRGVIGKEELDLMKPGAILLNVGRGTAVDTDALSDALYAGKLAGAGLDVTDPEPLPARHPIWDAPGALITPHVSGGYALKPTLEKILALSARNLERYEKGETLENMVDRTTGYARR